MGLKIKQYKNSIAVKCTPLIPSEFKYSLLDSLSKHYILTAENGEVIEDIKPDKPEFDEAEFKPAFLEADLGCTFEEFLELVRFPVGSVTLMSKEGKGKIAHLDFEPDGDVNMVWIDVFCSEIKNDLLCLIESVIEQLSAVQ